MLINCVIINCFCILGSFFLFTYQILIKNRGHLIRKSETQLRSDSNMSPTKHPLGTYRFTKRKCAHVTYYFSMSYQAITSHCLLSSVSTSLILGFLSASVVSMLRGWSVDLFLFSITSEAEERMCSHRDGAGSTHGSRGLHPCFLLSIASCPQPLLPQYGFAFSATVSAAS